MLGINFMKNGRSYLVNSTLYTFQIKVKRIKVLEIGRS